MSDEALKKEKESKSLINLMDMYEDDFHDIEDGNDFIDNLSCISCCDEY